tara:strand:- start:218 stop:391 length:174 start_codon:yes stop_codon:yes gene_type:complete
MPTITNNKQNKLKPNTTTNNKISCQKQTTSTPKEEKEKTKLEIAEIEEGNIVAEVFV